MSSLINLLMSLLMGSTLGQPIEEPKTAHKEMLHEKIEIYQDLKDRQHILEI